MKKRRKKQAVRVGVVGLGRLGREHARIYASMKETFLSGVVDTDPDRAGKVGETYGAPFFTHYSNLFPKVDAVSIAVPTHLHHMIARDFLKKGIHVLLEKPICRTLEEAEELSSISSKNRVILQVGHVERFNSALRYIQRRIKSPRFIECHRLGPYQERGTEVGVVLDLMIHDIDIIMSLVRSTVKRIDAVGVKVLSKYEDIANARILFHNGAVANVTSSRVSQERLRKLRIFEKDTYISLDFLNQCLSIYRRSSGRIRGYNPTVEKIEPLASELKHFVSCIFEKREPIVSGEGATAALRVALEISRKIAG